MADAEDRGEGSSHSARVRARELLGKHIGMWPNKVDITSTSKHHHVYDLSGMPDDELRRLRSSLLALRAGTGVASN